VTLTGHSSDPDHPVRFTAARLVDAGGGYSSQGATPVHFGLPPGVGKVDVVVEWFEQGRRRTARVSDVDPARFRGQWMDMRVGVR
jgi:ASPIC and UnbV